MKNRILKIGSLAKKITPPLLFWSWNLIFIVFFAYVALIEGAGFLKDVWMKKVSWDFSIFVLAAYSIPVMSVVLGFIFFRKKPSQLMGLFYGIEAPLILICILRLTLFRELNPSTLHLLILFVVGMATYLYDLFKPYPSSPTHRWIKFTGQQTLFSIGIYASLFLLFYSLPLGVFLIKEFFKFEWLFALGREIVHLKMNEIGVVFFFFMIGALFFFYTAALFVVLPFALVTLYLKSFLRGFRDFSFFYGQKKTWAFLGVAFILNAGVAYQANQQPQAFSFERLKTTPETKEEKLSLLKEADRIRTGLLNAYLSPYRYVSTAQQDEHLEYFYKEVFGSEMFARWAQNFHRIVAIPFLYQGSSMAIDQETAEKLYEDFFDISIQKGEKRAVEHALASTWIKDGREAGLLNIDQEKVFLSKQKIEVKEHGDWAEVEVYEHYENQTLEQQEVFYSFSLPENAAITGLWLGESEDKNKSNTFIVSPRGAAQQIYKTEGRRRVDPSLLEQVGPRQYRLRAFPVPGNSEFLDTKGQLHLWFSYKVFADENESWPLPKLLEKRNVFWSAKTQRWINRQPISPYQKDWFPEKINADHKIFKTAHHFSLENQNTLHAIPIRHSSEEPQGKKFAVILDTSYSMRRHAKEVNESIRSLKEKVSNKNEIDVYLGDKDFYSMSIKDFSSDSLLYFGSTQLYELLFNFSMSKGEKKYDAVFVMTDEGSYDLAKDQLLPLPLNSPLWLVHLGGLPIAYEDQMLETLEQNPGGIALSFEEAYQDYSLRQQYAGNTSVIAIKGGYLWSVDFNSSLGVDDPGFEDLAMKQWIQHLSSKNRTQNIDSLDLIHALAKQYEIVTPYSSMIVLVNDRQKNALKEAEKQKDRFEREAENGKEILSKPANVFHHITATPEPEEWVLIGFVCLFLFYKFQIQKKMRPLF